MNGLLAWMSRHEPLPEQIADLERYGLRVMIVRPPIVPALGRQVWRDSRTVKRALSRLPQRPCALMLVAPASIMRPMLRDRWEILRPVMYQGVWVGGWKRLKGVDSEDRFLLERWPE